MIKDLNETITLKGKERSETAMLFDDRGSTRSSRKVCKGFATLLSFLSVPLLIPAQTAPIYSYTVPAGGYTANSNVAAYADSVNGTWNMQYDSLNRLRTANATAGLYSGLAVTWGYDSFGNRLNQTYSGTTSATVPSASSATYDGNNHLTFSSLASSAPQYDAAGNLTYDGSNQIAYDAEGRVCAVFNGVRGGAITQYLYNAEGQRVAKGHPVDNVLACPTVMSNFVVTAKYILGPNGEQVTELDQSDKWVHSNVYAAGEILATYDTQGLHFPFTDGVGTKRVQASAAGAVELTCTNLPFGDGPVCAGATEHFFTGKERDTESGLDDFGARYYGSNMGRFSSPDYSDDPDPIPHADTSNPQSLNRYSYVLNNPLTNTDPDGHTCQTNSSDGNIYDDGDGQGCSIVDDQNAQYAAQHQAAVTVTAQSSGGFDSGSLAAGVFGLQSASTWNNAAGTVNGIARVEATIMAPWAGAAVDCMSGGSKASCGVNMALALLPGIGGELKGIGLLAKEESAIGGVLKQIASGTTRGKEFFNLGGSLPTQAAGYYREFTVPLSGESGRGAARLVTGAAGEIFYTADHYVTFTRIK